MLKQSRRHENNTKKDDYKGISVSTSINNGKTDNRILKNKIGKSCGGEKEEEQEDFTSGRPSLDHIYTIEQTIEKKKQKKKYT